MTIQDKFANIPDTARVSILWNKGAAEFICDAGEIKRAFRCDHCDDVEMSVKGFLGQGIVTSSVQGKFIPTYSGLEERVKTLEDALAQYANPLNWECTDRNCINWDDCPHLRDLWVISPSAQGAEIADLALGKMALHTAPEVEVREVGSVIGPKVAESPSVRYETVQRIIESADLSNLAQRDECNRLLHHNWSHEVGTPNYSKKAWQKLEAMIWSRD